MYLYIQASVSQIFKYFFFLLSISILLPPVFHFQKKKPPAINLPFLLFFSLFSFSFLFFLFFLLV